MPCMAVVTSLDLKHMKYSVFLANTVYFLSFNQAPKFVTLYSWLHVVIELLPTNLGWECRL